MATIVFPYAPLRIGVEAYLNSDWVTISGDVYQRQDIQISRGLSDETTAVTPSQCTMLLNNQTGNYNPRNPVGAYYGSIGRGTPIRVAVTAEADTFQRTTANGWGTSSEGYAWGHFESAGSAADYAVSAGTATHSVSGTNQYRVSYSPNSYLDVEVAITVSVLPGTAVTGASIEPANILFRGTGTTTASTYYMIRCVVNTDSTITISIQDQAGNIPGGPATATVTHSASTLRVKAQIEDGILRAKVWDPSVAEPFGWLVHANPVDWWTQGHTTTLIQQAAGWFGIRSGVAVSNTNTKPIVFSYTNLVVRIPRYSGNIVSLAPSQDISGKDKTAALVAASTLRRLSQGQANTQSVLRQTLPSLTRLVAYWPAEDGASATAIADASGRNLPMALNNAPTFAADSSFASSSPIPTLTDSYWFGTIAPYTAGSGTVQVRLLCHVPAGGGPDGMVLARWFTGGTIAKWDLVYHTAGSLTVVAYNPDGSVNKSMGPTALTPLDNNSVRISVQLVQSGSDIAMQVSTIIPGANSAIYHNDTVTGATLTTATALAINPTQNLNGTAIGHITVEANATDIFAQSLQLAAYAGETATFRLVRLGAAGDTFDYVGDIYATGVLMGPQYVDTFLNQLTSCQDTDRGLLYEFRGVTGLCYKSGGAHNAPATRLALDVSQNNLTAPPQVIDDDQQLNNDIVAIRTNGGSYEAILTTGPFSTLAPEAGGVGVYTDTITCNPSDDSRLADIANWALSIGTVDQARIPQVTINLANPRLGLTQAFFAQVLNVNIDTKISLANFTQDKIYLLVRGITENLNAYKCELVFNCAPASPYHTLVFADAANPATSDDRLDSDTATLNTAIATTSATSVSVATAGAPWTTRAADLPFDIVIDGERMSVTAVTGSTSPQTFTVTRSVNGVAKTHPTTGVPVRLFDPCYIGYGRT